MLIFDVEQRVFLGSADDQPRDDVGDAEFHVPRLVFDGQPSAFAGVCQGTFVFHADQIQSAGRGGRSGGAAVLAFENAADVGGVPFVLADTN